MRVLGAAIGGTIIFAWGMFLDSVNRYTHPAQFWFNVIGALSVFGLLLWAYKTPGKP
jgi:Na+/phosphate symporter